MSSEFLQPVLCVIPVRGGSKGLQGKNLCSLGGRSLLQWVCDTARATPALKRTVVSTDDEKMAWEARRCGVDVPFIRNSELALDTTPVVDVLIDAVQRVEEIDSVEFKYICLLQATSPFVVSDDIIRAVTMAFKEVADTVMTVYPVGQKHPEIMLTLKEDGEVQWYGRTRQRMARRQDLPPVYARSGLVYVISRDLLMKERTIYGRRTFAVEVDPMRALSIDVAEDLIFAETLIQNGNITPVATEPVSPISCDGAFESNWRKCRETSYVHWTREEPVNQIQLAFRNHWELFSEIMGRNNGVGLRCLEVGCGRGSLSCYFSDHRYDCTLLDSAPAAIAQARELFKKNGLKATFDIGDALAMPYEDDSFDVIFSIGLFEHFKTIQAPLKEQWRVLKQGGYLLLYIVPNKPVLVQDQNEWVNELLRAHPGMAVSGGSAKAPLYRNDLRSEPYVELLEEWGARKVNASGVYPLPMVSHSPEFPFTLMPETCERVLVKAFREMLAERRRKTGKNPWLCDEEQGQAFLVWAKK